MKLGLTGVPWFTVIVNCMCHLQLDWNTPDICQTHVKVSLLGVTLESGRLNEVDGHP